MTINIKIIGWKRSENVANLVIKAISGYFVQKRSICPASYIKADKFPILDMGLPTEYDYLLVLEPEQATIDDYKAMRKDGIVLVNTNEKKLATSIMNAIKKAKARSVLIDATGITMERIGQPDPTVAMVAALTKKTSIMSLKSLEEVVKSAGVMEGSLSVAEEVHKTIR